MRRHALEPLELAFRLLAGLLRQLGLLNLVDIVVDFRPAIFGLAQFLLNRFQLLPQEVILLGLVHLLARVALDLLAQGQHLLFPAEMADQHAQLVLEIVSLKNFLRLDHIDVGVIGHHVSQVIRVLDLSQEVRGFFGIVGRERHDLPRQIRQAAVQRLGLEVLIFRILRGWRDMCLQIGMIRCPELNPEALQAVHDDVQVILRRLRHALDAGNGSHFVNLPGHGFLDLGVLHGHQADQMIALASVFNQLDRAGDADRKRNDGVRKGHGVAQRQNRQFLWNILGGQAPGVALGIGRDAEDFFRGRH